jgi:phospholipase A1/A2
MGQWSVLGAFERKCHIVFKKQYFQCYLFIVLPVLFMVPVLAQPAGIDDNQDAVLAPTGVMIKAKTENAIEQDSCGCSNDNQSFIQGEEVVEQGLEIDKKFDISTHKPNFVLPLSYNKHPSRSNFPFFNEHIDHTEVEFQFSLKLLVIDDLWLDSNIYIAYTNHSFWQAYNKALSSPFRDTNHEPEIFVRSPVNFSVGQWRVRDVELGFVHESNGRSVPLSRSWNRFYVNVISDYKNFSFSLKPWYRVKEKAKSDPSDMTGDDNPDIEDYLGHFEFISVYHYHDQRLSLTIRNGFGFNHNGSSELAWSYPISDDVDVYVKYFYGYGRSLLDYNHRSNALGIGFSISNW